LPLVQRLVRLETRNETVFINGFPQVQQTQRGFFDTLGDWLRSPLQGLNEILSVIGVPLFQNANGGSPETQRQQVAITDLRGKITQIEAQKEQLVEQLKQKVLDEVSAFDELLLKARLEDAIVRRERQRMRIVEVGYRLGEGDTLTMLSMMNALDQRKMNASIARQRMRSQAEKIRRLVLQQD